MIDYSMYGGTPYVSRLNPGPVAYGADPAQQVWGFGWIPPDDRTSEEQQIVEATIAEMPRFEISGRKSDDPKKAVMWECSKVVNNGQHFRTFYQKTGSCVGNGGGQATWYLSAVEVVRLKDPEQALLPFYLLPYGRSRMYAGMRGRGDGSFGSAFAKAIRTDGVLPANTEGLPKYTDEGGISWGSSAEYEWSDGEAIAAKWLEKSRKYIVKTTAQLKSADDAREALRNYYPCTIASDWGGQMSPSVQDGVLLNRRVTTWQHQMSLQGWWDHPTLGEIFYILNSWGVGAHGQPPDDSPPGGFWVKKADVENIVRQGDSFAFSQFDGFPAQDLSWYV